MPLIETKGAASAQGFGLTLSSGAIPYIEDVFSTWLYTGNGSTQTITNGIDLSTKGGLVWIKGRSSFDNHFLVDTVRGANNYLVSNSTWYQNQVGSLSIVPAFASNGFTSGNFSGVGTNGTTYASWTFRKQPKFFDIVTYTGNGTSGRTVAHNLNSVPGCIIVKRTDLADNWNVYHRGLTSAGYLVQLNTTIGQAASNAAFNTTDPTSTVFTVGNGNGTNASGGTYVAYLFAHDAGGFGLSGADNVISCGSYVGTSGSGSSGPVVTLGWEPQWVLIKRNSGGVAVGNWQMIDNMRGMVMGGNDEIVQANLSDAATSDSGISPTATGFQVTSSSTEFNSSGTTYIYIAIRRGPMKVPTSGTSVFTPITYVVSGGGTGL